MLTKKLIIFDLDGTLVNSIADLTDAVNRVRAQFGRDELTREGVQQLVGQGARNLIERALPGATEEETDCGLNAFLAYNDAHLADRTVLYPGVTETLNRLKSRGKQMALISNKNEDLCRKLLDQLGIGHYFAAILGGDSLSSRKPSPEPLQKLMVDLQSPPDHTVMVGDSIYDIAAGKAAAVMTVACSYGYGNEAELESADFIIDSLPSLLEIIG